ncbi:PH domain leucine-rich repeat-containing protein phosphatase 2-like isoform X3 [Octopus vulgaris]|uniref:PH domain leucine-rich repeat-containing protein phosphatase 2-like isoform X3 n=1 Tax=Octopus vulgaris TaxID=6645 RepID=A0AA36AXU4_OCTVU|nr:PH domain leucine-rich repeat-containing protein phosphatase 2-like isoform X3 [Octopus vulgaris]
MKRKISLQRRNKESKKNADMSIRSYSAFGSNFKNRHNFANSSNRSSYSSIHSYTKSEQYWWNYTDNAKGANFQRAVSGDRRPRFEDDTWDLADSLADLYLKVNEENIATASKFTVCKDPVNDIDVKKWIEEDTSHGFIRVFVPNGDVNSSRLVPCNLSTNTQRICAQCGVAHSSLHVQFNGDIIARMESTDHPLAIQNEFLGNLGYTEPRKIQEEGFNPDLSYLIKFYLGKPVQDSTFTKAQLSSVILVRKGKLIYQWVQRLCAISGTRLFIHRDKFPSSKKSTMQLAKGYVEEMKFKDHPNVLKLTITLHGERSIYLSFNNTITYSKWLKRVQKATAKLPTKADLSKCNLEFLPDTIFINEDLRTLNLRHNVLRERPLEEDIHTMGWLDDLPRFRYLTSLNLANNDLKSFPSALCSMQSLTELNLASNKLEEIPPSIADLTRLQVLRLHNNHLTALPEEMGGMKQLSILILAFNYFTTVPSVLLRIHSISDTMESIIMAGNYIERLQGNLLNQMKLVKKIDFRFNRLTLMPSEIAKFQCLEFMSHLDIRDNSIEDLDIRALKGLVYINCERNGMRSLQLSGVALKYIYAKDNALSLSPKPEWLVEMDLSHNKLRDLPTWIAECFFMARLEVSHNMLHRLPILIFTTAQKLQDLRAHHNCIRRLPSTVTNNSLTMLQLQHNYIEELPHDFLVNANKLKYLNLSKNLLVNLPSPNSNESLNRLQHLFLTANRLHDDVFLVISNFPRLKRLHLAQNFLTDIPDSTLSKLEALEELNISSNNLSHFPSSLCKHKNLQILRANCNRIRELPAFKEATELKVLEVGFNQLFDIPMSNLVNSHVNLLDISGNPNITFNTTALQDLTLCVAILNKPKFNKNGEDGLFGIFDGGRNDEVARTLAEIMAETLLEELYSPLLVPGGTSYMKYALLSCHRKLKSIGQKIGASAAICHIKILPESNEKIPQYCLTVANVGMVQVVLCRNGQAMRLTHQFAVESDRSECMRIQKSDGIVTEDGLVNGITPCTRLIGCSYLYPQLIPKPHIRSIKLQHDDQFIIIANQELWKYISIEEAVSQISPFQDPVVSAKVLQDLAQGYGATENLCVVVINLKPLQISPFSPTPSQVFNFPQLYNNNVGELTPKLWQNKAQRDALPSNNSSALCSIAESEESDESKNSTLERKKKKTDSKDTENEISLSSHPASQIGSETTSIYEWEELLQRKLAKEVKSKEVYDELKKLEKAAKEEMESKDTETEPTSENNRSTVVKSIKKNAENQEELVTSHQANSESDTKISTDQSETSTELREDCLYDIPPGIDRDAILFYKMQMARFNSGKSGSLSSVQSVPMYTSLEDMFPPHIPSQSIEVLVRAMPNITRSITRDNSKPKQNSVFRKKVSESKYHVNEKEQPKTDPTPSTRTAANAGTSHPVNYIKPSSKTSSETHSNSSNDESSSKSTSSTPGTSHSTSYIKPSSKTSSETHSNSSNDESNSMSTSSNPGTSFPASYIKPSSKTSSETHSNSSNDECNSISTLSDPETNLTIIHVKSSSTSSELHSNSSNNESNSTDSRDNDGDFTGSIIISYL